MARHVCLGLQYLHFEKEIVHRDIKSMNVLVTNNYGCKLTDFGTVRLLSDSTKKQAAKITLEGIGTLRYMSPELRRGEEYGYPADIYSMGVVLFEIFENAKVELEGPVEDQYLAFPASFKVRLPTKPSPLTPNDGHFR